MNDQAELERCPTCGGFGCTGCCNADDVQPDDLPAVDARCTVCRECWVDAANGYDTCAACLKNA